MSKPISFDGRISIIKMMVLPLISFLSSMLSLNPPMGYWDKLHSLIGKFIWNNKKPTIKLTTLQRDKSDGGWGVPDFIIYFWSFVLRIINSWLDPRNPTSWRPLEEGLVYPCRLIYVDFPIKHAKELLGPINASVLVTWKLVINYTNINDKWHYHTPIFQNHNLLLGSRPAAYPIWSNCRIHLLGQLFHTEGLRTFQGTVQFTWFFLFSLFSTLCCVEDLWGPVEL